MKYYIDTEFDGWQGRLMSLAMVREDGQVKYWIVKGPVPKDPWVLENVVPIMHRGPYEVVTKEDLSKEIWNFIKKDTDPIIVVDWLTDIQHFCDVMVFGPGKCRSIKHCKFEFNRAYGTYESRVPHNAYYDALAIYNQVKNFS